jgi:hypothetical protein
MKMIKEEPPHHSDVPPRTPQQGVFRSLGASSRGNGSQKGKGKGRLSDVAYGQSEGEGSTSGPEEDDMIKAEPSSRKSSWRHKSSTGKGG